MAFPAGCEKNASASNPSASNQFKMLWWAACVVLDSNHVSNNSTASWVQWRKHTTKLLAAKRKKQGKKKQTTAHTLLAAKVTKHGKKKQTGTKQGKKPAHTVLVAEPVHDGVLAATTPLVAETAATLVDATLVDAFAADVLPGSQLYPLSQLS